MLDNLFELMMQEFGDKVAFTGLAFQHENGTISVDIHEDGYYAINVDQEGGFGDDYIAHTVEELVGVIKAYVS